MVLTIGLVTAGLIGICVYQYAADAAAARAIVAQREALANARSYAVELAAMQADGRQLNDKVTSHRAPWSWSEQLPLMVTQISGIMTDSGIKIDTLQPVTIVERQHLTRFPLRLTLRADLASLTAVLQRIQQAVPLLAVDHCAIRAGQKPGEPLQVEMTLSSYVIVGGSSGGRP